MYKVKTKEVIDNLPTDAEIVKEARSQYNVFDYDCSTVDKRADFASGAEWMRNKIISELNK